MFEETIPKLLVNLGNRILQDSHKNQYLGPISNFSVTAPQRGAPLFLKHCGIGHLKN